MFGIPENVLVAIISSIGTLIGIAVANFGSRKRLQGDVKLHNDIAEHSEEDEKLQEARKILAKSIEKRVERKYGGTPIFRRALNALPTSQRIGRLESEVNELNKENLKLEEDNKGLIEQLLCNPGKEDASEKDDECSFQQQYDLERLAETVSIFRHSPLPTEDELLKSIAHSSINIDEFSVIASHLRRRDRQLETEWEAFDRKDRLTDLLSALLAILTVIVIVMTSISANNVLFAIVAGMASAIILYSGLQVLRR